jgi:O-antigen chain-terminating methyltransferase
MSGQVVHNNPHIAAATLEERLRVELGRPLGTADKAAAQSGSTPSAVHRRMCKTVQGLKARLRSAATRSGVHRVGPIREALLWLKSLALLQRTRGDVRQAARTVEHMSAQLRTVEHMSTQLRYLEARIVEMERQHGEATARLSAQMATWGEHLDVLRNSTTVSLNQVRDEVRIWQHVLEAQTQSDPLSPGPQGLGTSMVASRLAATSGVTTRSMPHGMDSLFLQMSYAFRGSRADIKERVARYLPDVREACGATPGPQVLDIGCGRGELLEVLRDAGIHANGVDLNRLCVELCSDMGLSAKVADGLATLKATETGTLSAIAALHVVEHMAFEDVVDLLDQAHRCLRSGGVLILETPNPESLMVGARGFYFDPTHRLPIPPDLLALVARERGYADVRVDRMHPYPDGSQLDASIGRTEQLLNQLLFGPQDYCVVARRA